MSGQLAAPTLLSCALKPHPTDLHKLTPPSIKECKSCDHFPLRRADTKESPENAEYILFTKKSELATSKLMLYGALASQNGLTMSERYCEKTYS